MKKPALFINEVYKLYFFAANDYLTSWPVRV